jgi:hypothetical protein
MEENSMTKKGFVQIASRALALNMVMWSAAELALVLARVFSVAHYLNFQGRSPSQEYFLRGRNYVASLSLGLERRNFHCFRVGVPVWPKR